MANKLCQSCQKKQFDNSVRGTCLAPNKVPQANLPQGHQPWTDSPSFTLCEPCADKFGLCQACWGPLTGFSGFTVPTDKQFCRQFSNDNGNHVEGMYIGEQILAQLPVDMFSGKSWQVVKLSPGVRFHGQRIVTDGGQFGEQELYFDLTAADVKAVIELQEAYSRSNYYWYPPPATNNSTWKVTVEVKH